MAKTSVQKIVSAVTQAMRPTAEVADPDVARIDKLMVESQRRRSWSGAGSSQLSVEEQARRNGARFLGDHSVAYWPSGTGDGLENQEGYKLPAGSASTTASPVTKQRINRTQTAMIAMWAAMTERPVTVKFEPIETADPELYTLRAKAVRRLELAVELGQIEQLEGFTTEQLQGTEFIEEARAQFLIEKLVNQMTGERLLAPEDFIILDDAETAKAAKTLWDNRWQKCNGDKVIHEHALYFQIFGFQPIRFQWNEQDQNIEIENIHGLSVWPDPVHTLIEQWDYLVFEYYMPLTKALARWPQFAKQLKRGAEEGLLVTQELVYPSTYVDQQYEREMVQVRTAWERSEPVPMTAEEAIEREMVIPRETPEGIDGYILAGTEDVVYPARTGPEGKDLPPSAKWPKTFGIMQTQVLPQIGKTLDKRRCPYAMIPFGWTVNIPWLHTPWGLGELYRLEDIQNAINREITSLVNWTRWYSYPCEYWPADVYNDMTRKGFKGHSRPGRVVPIPRALWDQMIQRGRMGFTTDPPPLPRDRVALLDTLLREHDRLSGHVEALQGRATSGTSGRLQEQLRSEARGPLGVKAKGLEWTVERIAMLGMDAFTKWLRPAMWKSILSGYPDHVIEELRNRIKPTSWKVTVEASTGRQLSRAMREDESLALFNANLLDRRTALEDHQREPEHILRRRRQDRDDEMELARREAIAAREIQGMMPPAGDEAPPTEG